MKWSRGVVVVIVATTAVAACRKPAVPDGVATSPAAGVKVKEPNVAGKFYPGDADALRTAVRSYLDGVKADDLPGEKVAVFVPHAGYEYSGRVAAEAYARLRGIRPATFILVGPSHYCREPAIAAPTYGSFATPLGEVAVDGDFIAGVKARCDAVVTSDAPFAEEHCLEVQLPFLQVFAPGAKVAPFIFCQHDPDTAARFGAAVAETVKKSGADAVIVCSVDLSHYHPYDEAVRLDGAFVEAFNRFDAAAIFGGEGKDFEIDAPGAVAATFVAARALGATRAVTLAQRNSGDVTGQTEGGVVGYFAGVLVKDVPSP